MIFFRDEEITIRTLEIGDADLLVKWLSDPAVLEYYEGRDRPHDVDLVKQRFYENREDIIQCIIQYRTTDIGYIQFYLIDEEEREIYDFKDYKGTIYGMDQFIGETDYWNQGIGSHLIKATVNYLIKEKGATKIVMDPQAWNTRAIRVYEKNGFVKKKFLEKYEWHEGEYRDCWLIEYDRINRSKPQLILDVAGVLVTNLSATYWQEASLNSELHFDSLRTLFKNEVREALWTGKMSEEQFWEWLNKQCPMLETHSARDLLVGHLKLLPAIEHLDKWSRLSDIHLLSNHRMEWLSDLLEPINSYIKSMTISSEVGCCKPDPLIYKLVESRLTNHERILFVDDQEKNLIPAKQLGWTTIRADTEGKWTDEVSLFLNRGTQ